MLGTYKNISWLKFFCPNGRNMHWNSEFKELERKLDRTSLRLVLERIRCVSSGDWNFGVVRRVSTAAERRSFWHRWAGKNIFLGKIGIVWADWEEQALDCSGASVGKTNAKLIWIWGMLTNSPVQIQTNLWGYQTCDEPCAGFNHSQRNPQQFSPNL